MPRMSSGNGRFWLPLFAIALAPFFVACDSVPIGPSLSNVTFTPAIDSPSGWELAQKATIADPTVCCCHVTGNVTNRNTVPLHVTITFAAMNHGGQQLGRIVYFAQDLQAGATRSIEASGFLIPCASIDHVNYELNVSSVGGTPPL